MDMYVYKTWVNVMKKAIRATRYALNHGMLGGGYISTSNCVYTGMPLSRYELMLKVWRNEGNYQEGGNLE